MPIESMLIVEVRVEGELVAAGFIDPSADTDDQVVMSYNPNYSRALVQASLLLMAGRGLPPVWRVKVLSAMAWLVGQVGNEEELPF